MSERRASVRAAPKPSCPAGQANCRQEAVAHLRGALLWWERAHQPATPHVPLA